MALLDLAQIHLLGPPAQMGMHYGTVCRDLIRGFVDQRMRAAAVYLREHGIRDADLFMRPASGCLAALKNWDHDGWVEHCATAEAAGIDAAQLYAAGNMTDIRDIVALSGKAEAEGCSEVLIPAARSATGDLIAAQTWDLNPTDLDFVVAVQRKPEHGPATWSITCAGCPSLMGMNEHGVTVGTTNIKTTDARIGVPYLSVLHRAIRASTRAQAVALIEQAPRAAAHNFWIADASGASELECSARSVSRRELAADSIAHTNHCLAEANGAIEAEVPSPSSRARFTRLQALLSASKHDVASIRQLFTDRSDGVDSINRFAEDNQGTATDACMIAIPARRELWACRGSSDRGEWMRLDWGR
jgi:isopenicillin-N N-acyltransferase like protein